MQQYSAVMNCSDVYDVRYRARIVLIFRDYETGPSRAALTLLHLRPQKLGAHRYISSIWPILDGHSNVIRNGKSHNTAAEKTSTSLSSTFIRRQNILVYKVQKKIYIYMYIIIVQVLLEGTLISYLQTLFLLLCTY
jgi:hypothetical protein